MPDPVNSLHTAARWIAESGIGPLRDSCCGKRRERRKDWQVPLELRESGETHYVDGQSISPHGISLVSYAAFPYGARVYVRRGSDEAWAPCRVAHVTPSFGFYRVGVVWDFGQDD